MYRCTSAFLAVKYCGCIFFKSLSYPHEVVRKNVYVNFGTLWPQLAMEMGILYSAVEKAIPSKINVKTESKSTYKQ